MWFRTYCGDLEKELRVRAIQTSLMVVHSIGQLSLLRHLCPPLLTGGRGVRNTLLWLHFGITQGA